MTQEVHEFTDLMEMHRELFVLFAHYELPKLANESELDFSEFYDWNETHG